MPERSNTVLVTTTSYNNDGEAYSIIDPNAIEQRKTFDDAGRLTQIVDNYTGGTPSGDADRTTQFTYNPDDQVLTRTDKNGTTGDQVTQYVYGTANATNDVLSRIAGLVDSDGAATHLADYTYLGLGTVVVAASPQPGSQLTYIQQTGDTHANTDGGDQYTGFDRFGRVIDQYWLKPGTGDLERIQYGFDRASNRQWRDNLVADVVAGSNYQDEYYNYDGLNQLQVLTRGQLNSGRTGISGTPTWEEDFTFDPTGNWGNYTTKTGGSTSLNQNRTHNMVNELATLSGSGSLVGFDAAGNMTTAPQPGSWGSAYTLVWDAWNRLVSVANGGTTVATYAYDGLMLRATKATSGSTRHFYYSAQWQILEERIGSATSAQRHFVWGLRYSDDLVLRDRDTTGGGTLNERFYALHDYFNPTAVADTSGAVQERYGYDAYGTSRVMAADFSLRATSSYGWETRFAAYRWDSESGFYQVRYRYLHPKLGRWLSRDTVDNEVERNLYRYALNSPLNHTDNHGLDVGEAKTDAIWKDGNFEERKVTGACGTPCHDRTIGTVKIDIACIKADLTESLAEHNQDVINYFSEHLMINGINSGRWQAPSYLGAGFGITFTPNDYGKICCEKHKWVQKFSTGKVDYSTESLTAADFAGDNVSGLISRQFGKGFKLELFCNDKVVYSLEWFYDAVYRYDAAISKRHSTVTLGLKY